MKKIIETIDPNELTVARIRQVATGFNFMLDRSGGYKGYEVQCIEALLAEIDRLCRPVTEREPPHCPTCDCPTGPVEK